MRVPLCLVALWFLVAPVALADIAPDPLAGLSEPRPMDEKAARGISMKHEEVTLELHDAFVIVDATFTMANPGPAKELLVGFPGSGVPLGEDFAAHVSLKGFSVWVEGKAIPSEARDIEHSWEWRGFTKTRSETWHVFTARFASGDTKIRVRYGVVSDPYHGVSINTGEEIHGRRVWYILATGALWTGPIGEIVVRIKARGGVKPEGIRVRTRMKETAWRARRDGTSEPTPDATRDAEGITLRSRQLEPTLNDNLQIVYTPDPTRIPRTSSEWNTGPATELLLKALEGR